jgi:hypothetical protein
MKKAIYFLLMICLLIAPSCKKDDPKKDDAKSTIEYPKEDYQKVVKEIPEADGFFIEAVYQLSDLATEKDLKNLKPINVTYLFQWVGKDDVALLAAMDRDFVTGKTSKIVTEPVSSPWEDTKIGNFDGVISLEKALEKLNATNYRPNTAFVTLRKPVIYKTTLRYMFGDKVYVDAMTGEVFGPEE